MQPDRFSASNHRLGPADRPYFPPPPNRAWLYGMLIWVVLLGWLLNVGRYWQANSSPVPQATQQLETFDWRPQPWQELPAALP
jgi:hypothetical protein